MSIERDLRALAAEMRKMAREAVPAVVDGVGEDALRLVLLGFDAARAPSGVAWAPLKRGTGKPLEGTGALRGGIKLLPSSRGFKLTSDASYGAYHQEGTDHMPARPFLPSDTLSPTLERSLEAAAERALDKVSR